MSAPIVFVSHNAVKQGKLEGFRDAFADVARPLDAEKPGTVVFLAFANEDGTQVSVVHVFPDAAAMGVHLEGVEERMGRGRRVHRDEGLRDLRDAQRAGARSDASLRERAGRPPQRPDRPHRRVPPPESRLNRCTPCPASRPPRCNRVRETLQRVRSPAMSTSSPTT
jgi:quinol monooxygenase YgiN